MKWYNKFLPNEYVLSIKDINYQKLQEQGIKALFFDLDNTIIPYDIEVIPHETKEFLEGLTQTFKVVVVSNSRKKRVSKATQDLNGIAYVKFSRKPLKFGFKKARKIVCEESKNIAAIGDQIMTDVYGGNRMKFGSVIFVNPIKKRSDHFFTRINRKFERMIMKKIKKKNPEKYYEVLEAYAEPK